MHVCTLNMPTRHSIPEVPVTEHRSRESAHSSLTLLCSGE